MTFGSLLGRPFRSSKLHAAVFGISVFFLLWYLLVDLFEVWRFGGLPKLVKSVEEWLSPDPVFGVSIHTAEYYRHIWASIVRVASAFFLATTLGIAIGDIDGMAPDILRANVSDP